MAESEVTVVKCSCNDPDCNVYDLSDGTFSNGSRDRQQLEGYARAINSHAALVEALTKLKQAARVIDSAHHAGIPIDSKRWSQLYNACNDATEALALVEGEPCNQKQ